MERALCWQYACLSPYWRQGLLFATGLGALEDSCGLYLPSGHRSTGVAEAPTRLSGFHGFWGSDLSSSFVHDNPSSAEPFPWP